MKNILLFFTALFSYFSMNAQDPTLGLLYRDAAVTDGFVLFSPLLNNEVFLINPCGEKVNQWTFTEEPGATCYLLANGNLLRAGKDHIEIRDWNNTIIWSYATTANGLKQHHDITPLPNGNILCIVADGYNLSQMTAAGRNPAITAVMMKLEKIVELQPVGTNAATIVWEWKFKDHLIQDFDATKLNYGVVQNHPELLDINFNNNITSDYIHCNGIDYNANLNQILISARHLNEIYIIDHSTTTAQAASHTGGNSNKGGDLLWRWGNPQVYRQGAEANRKLFWQHNAMWVENGYLDAGKISVFNNGAPGTAQTGTTVHLLVPEIVTGNYTMTNTIFNPSNFDWSWSGNILGVPLYEDKQSGIQSQPNGNLIISEASLGRVSELTKTGTLLWSYKNPTGPTAGSATTYYSQGTTTVSNSFFKAEKYPANFPGFIGHTLNPNGILENENSLSGLCNPLSVAGFNAENLQVLNPIKNGIIELNSTIDSAKVKLYDANGRILLEKDTFSGNQLHINLTPAVYYLKLENDKYKKTIKLIVQ
jgi:hypothetical protein